MYTQLTSRLIAQFRTIRETLDSEVDAASKGAIESFDLESFCQNYGLSCRSALNRFKVGVPATVLHGDSALTGHGSSSSSSAHASDSAAASKPSDLVVFHCVQHFITCMDCLKLSMRAVDELHPPMSDLMDSLNKCTYMAHDHTCKATVRQWLITLSQMKASQEINDDQARQMAFELDAAYNAFHKYLQQNGQPQ